MSNNKQIEKPLELPHQETIVGTNTIQTKPFDNQKIEIMSNNKQSSVEWLIRQYEMKGYIGVQDKEQAKAMHKEEIVESWSNGYDEEDRATSNPFKYYNETFEGNNED